MLKNQEKDEIQINMNPDNLSDLYRKSSHIIYVE